MADQYAPPITVEELLQELEELKEVNGILSSAGKELETIVAETKSQWMNSEQRANEAEARAFALEKNLETEKRRAEASDEHRRLAGAARVEAEMRSARAEENLAEAERGRLEAEARVELIEHEINAVSSNQAEQHAERAIERAEAQRMLAETTAAHERDRRGLEAEMEQERLAGELSKEALRSSLTDRILHLSLQLCSLEEAHSMDTEAHSENVPPQLDAGGMKESEAKVVGRAVIHRKAYQTPPRPPPPPPLGTRLKNV